MGWLKLASPSHPSGATTASNTVQEELKTATQHIESIHISPPTATNPPSSSPSSTSSLYRKYPYASPSTPDTHLPFIPASEVRLRKPPEAPSASSSPPQNPSPPSTPTELWLVIDSIVYDCSAFVAEHPGGEQVLESFRGEDCSWQFWRFHGKQQMEEFGVPLRVGRTAGVENRFKKRTRWVGLRGLGSGEEW